MGSPRPTKPSMRTAALLAQGLRICKHRSFCYKCKALTKHVVGNGMKPTCVECHAKATE